MKTKPWWIAILAMFLAGCASQGDAVRIGVSMPRGEKATIVAHNQSYPDWMLDGKKLRLNYVVKGTLTSEQMVAVAEAERACRIYTGTVRPSNLVAVLSSGTLYALAGGIGVGLGSQAFAGAVAGEYARYGAAASGFAGAANGLITLGGQTYTFENCGRTLLVEIFADYGVKVLQKSPY